MTTKYRHKSLLSGWDVENFSTNLVTFTEELYDILEEVPEEFRESVDLKFEADGYIIYVDVGYEYEETQEVLQKELEDSFKKEEALLKERKRVDLETLKSLMETYGVETTTNLEDL